MKSKHLKENKIKRNKKLNKSTSKRTIKDKPQEQDRKSVV